MRGLCQHAADAYCTSSVGRPVPPRDAGQVAPGEGLGTNESAGAGIRMTEWLTFLSERVIVLIDALALLVIVVGTVEVVIRLVHALIRPVTNYLLRDAWLHYSRWLVAALTFQLAADIIETSISTNWQTIGRVAAVAVIRTFLNYFLDRDLEVVRQRQRDSSSRPSPPGQGSRA